MKQVVKGVIVTDLDGVLFSVVQGVADFLRGKYNLVVREDQCTAWDLGAMVDQSEGSDADKTRARLEVYKMISSSADFYWNLKPYPGAQRAVNELAEHFDIVGLTSRPQAVFQTTRKTMARDFPAVRETHVTRVRLKPKVAAEFHPTWVLEDNPDTVEAYLAEKFHVFYVRHAYGRDIWVRRGSHRLATVPDTLTAAQEILRLAGHRALVEGVAS